ncbi:MAG: alpha/beta hydrolase [Actinomycetota bacterium]
MKAIGARSRLVEVEGGGRLYVEEDGEGPPIVFLHPGLWDCRTWDDQFASFGDRYRVLRYDARGYGRSSRLQPGVAYSHVRDLVAVLDDAGIDRAAFVGCSMGGGLEIDFALEHPSRVAALVLAAPGLSGFEGTEEEEAEWTAWDQERQGPIDALVEAGELEQAQDLRLKTMWAPLGTDDAGGRRIREIAFDNLHEITMDESGEEAIDPPAAGRLGDIHVPTLILPADHDPPWHLRICEVLAEGIPNVRLVQIPETDHVVNLRQPAEFNRVVLAFLAEVL